MVGAVARGRCAVGPEEEGCLNEAFAAASRAVVPIMSVRAVAPLGGAEDATEGSLRNKRPGLSGRPPCKGVAMGVARKGCRANNSAILKVRSFA